MCLTNKKYILMCVWFCKWFMPYHRTLKRWSTGIQDERFAVTTCGRKQGKEADVSLSDAWQRRVRTENDVCQNTVITDTHELDFAHVKSNAGLWTGAITLDTGPKASRIILGVTFAATSNQSLRNWKQILLINPVFAWYYLFWNIN